MSNGSSTPSSVSCPSSGFVDPYKFCQCTEDPDSSSICWLWGVPWYWLAVTLAIWVLAVLAAKIIDVLVAITSIFMRKFVFRTLLSTFEV